MSLQAIRSNKLRSSLTLVGIVLGRCLDYRRHDRHFGHPGHDGKRNERIGHADFPGAEVAGRILNAMKNGARQCAGHPMTLSDAQAIRDHVQSVDIVGAEIWDFGFKAEYRDQETNDNLAIVGGTPEYAQNNTHFVGQGRNISQMDVHAGRKVVVIGHAIAQRLYPFVDPVGREIRVDSREYEVIGVFDEKKSAFGSQYDNYILMPVSSFLSTYGDVDRNGFPRSVNITVHARTPEIVDDAIAETRAVLRRVRGVSRGEEDNFDYFNSEGMIREFNQMTANIKVGAFVIGIIALLVAGIGIMNIMLVSVTERTKEIGIRKSLGAKPPFILRQFLLEAVVLCNLGGVIGVAVGFGIGNMMVKLGMSPTFETVVPMQWAVIGLLFCTAVGVIFGMLPAIKASRLNPIDALRYE